MIYKHTLRQQILTNIGPKPLEKNEYKIHTKFNLGKNLKIVSFGKHNKDKIFYIIKRTPGSGLFSNLTTPSLSSLISLGSIVGPTLFTNSAK